ncbi:MAG: C39 family peptidase, partial [bacterium]|nr:C39 family peptidase [bacterium]
KTECLSYNKKLALGKAKVKKPDTNDILEYLKINVPVIVAIRSSLLYDEKLTESGHFIVIRKYRNGVFYYNDPTDGKTHTIKEEVLRFIWFNNVIDSSAYFLAIWPKQFPST